MSSSSSSARPVTVTASFYLWLITVLIGLIGAVVLFVLSGSAEIADAPATSEGIAPATFVIAAVIAIVVSIVQLIVVFQMKAGKNWARIVLLVLAVIQVITAFTGSGAGSWTAWVGVVTVVIATVLMFLPASNPYFRRAA